MSFVTRPPEEIGRYERMQRWLQNIETMSMPIIRIPAMGDDIGKTAVSIATGWAAGAQVPTYTIQADQVHLGGQLQKGVGGTDIALIIQMPALPFENYKFALPATDGTFAIATIDSSGNVHITNVTAGVPFYLHPMRWVTAVEGG